MKSISLFFIVYVVIIIHGSAQDPNLKLWYDKPAEIWTDALPIGNGRLGAMVFGDPLNERIQFNEETVWTGGPRDYSRKGAVKHLDEIRDLLRSGEQSQAEALAEKEFMGKKFNEDGYESQKTIWLREILADDKPAMAGYDDASWRTMRLPVSNGWESAGLEGVDGAVWFRTKFDVPDDWAGKDLVVALGRIRDVDITFLNGEKLGTTKGSDNREYLVKGSQLRKTGNILAVQVVNYYDKGGFTGSRNNQQALVIYPKGTSPASAISLSKEWRYWVQDTQPPAFPRYQADYQPFGDVLLQFQHDKTTSDYRRELDLENAISKVSYVADGTRYTRSYFATAKDQTVVIHMTADKPGKVSLHASLQSPHTMSRIQRADDRTLQLDIEVKNGVIKGTSYLRATTRGGHVDVTDSAIIVKDADEVTLYLVAGTNFKNYHDVSGDPVKTCQQWLQKLEERKYADIERAHIEDYQRYFRTLSLDLGKTENERLPTNERLLRYTSVSDPSLVTLYLQYARYLLISSSRPGTQPANLQGIWNPLLNPPWGSKYTTNINVEMNYWPAHSLNLTPCIEPFFSMIRDVSETGKLTAENHYGAPGWVLHHNTDLWRGTAPINAANHGIWVTGGAWFCHHLWDHYLYTKDKTFLKEWYPVIRNSSEFFVSFLVKDDATGWLISTPSNSPEQGGLVAGPTMDHQLIRELFKSCITASEILNTDDALREKLKKMVNEIAPNQIGKHGQLQEWLEDKDDPMNKHRHVSHLWGVYPGTDITWNTPQLMDAARQSLIHRGDGGTGWSLAWKVNLWARFKDGDHTLMMIDKLLELALDSAGKERGGAYNNLFDAHPPFQIDGNFGGAAGIAEMLVQSHMPYIDILPALPRAFPTGMIKGVCVRGNFELNIQWEKNKLKKIDVISRSGGKCFLKYGNKEIRLDTRIGKTYTLDGDLSLMTK